MGWETTLYTSLHFNRKTYEYKYEVEGDIDELTKSINRCRQELRDLATMTDPDKMLRSSADAEYTNAYDLITYRFDEIIEIYEEDLIERAKLQKLLDEWDVCHDKNTNLAIGRPKNIKYSDSFLDGDYIKTVEQPDLKDTLFDKDNTESTYNITNSDSDQNKKTQKFESFRRYIYYVYKT